MANLADRISSRTVSEQQFLEARQRLALAMGTPLEDIVHSPDPIDPLPKTRGVLDQATQPAIDKALTRRADYLAAQRRITGARVL